MGDNRDHSNDSRSFGPAHRRHRGRACPIGLQIWGLSNRSRAGRRAFPWFRRNGAGQPSDWSSGLVIILLLLLYIFRALVPPILLAFVLAYVLKPLADWVEKKLQVRRTLAVILVYRVLAILSIVPVTWCPTSWSASRASTWTCKADGRPRRLSLPALVILDYHFSLGEPSRRGRHRPEPAPALPPRPLAWS